MIVMRADFWFWKVTTVLGVCAIATCALSFFTSRSIDRSRITLTERYARAIAVVESLNFRQASENEAAIRFVISGERNDFDRILSLRNSFAERMNLLKSIDSSAGARARAAAIWAAKKDLQDVSIEPFASRLAGAPAARIHAFLEANGRWRAQVLSEALDRFLRFEVLNMHRERTKVGRSVRHLNALLGTSFVVMFLVFTVLILLLRRLESARENTLEQSRLVADARKTVLETVAHDLKNPLGAIKMSMELAQEDPASPVESVAELLAITERSAGSMEDLVSDLLDHSKIESGKFTVDPRPMSLSDLLSSLTERFRLIARAKGVDLRTDLAENLVVRADAKRIEQLVSNLVGNAIKFTPAGGAVRVVAEACGTQVRFAVVDSGPGLSDAEAKRVFDRYWQASATAAKGTGLGLAICKAIADAHRGRLWVEKNAPSGAIFCFEMPGTRL